MKSFPYIIRIGHGRYFITHITYLFVENEVQQTKKNFKSRSLTSLNFSYAGLTINFHGSGSFHEVYNSNFLISAVISNVLLRFQDTIFIV